MQLMAEEKVNELEDTAIETIQKETQREKQKNFKVASMTWETTLSSLIYV